MAPSARSRRVVITRSPRASTIDDGSLAMLVGEERAKEGLTRSGERHAEPFRDRRAEVREGLASPDVYTGDALPQRKDGHALTRMVSRRRRWIVAVIGGDEEQVVLPQGGQE